MLAGFEETLLLIVQDDSELLEMCQKCIYQLKNTTAEHHFFVPRKKSYLQDPTCIALTKAFQQELQRAGSEGQKEIFHQVQLEIDHNFGIIRLHCVDG